jgi:hypothetical protein
MDCRRRMEQFLVFAGVAAAFYLLEEERDRKRSGRPSARRRNRRTVEEVYDCLGSSYFRRAYRMSYQSFWTLHSNDDAHLPRQRLCEMVQQQHLVRPRAFFHARVSL